MDAFLEFAKFWGLPFALLLGLAVFHARTVRAKDAEIQRLNEARLKEKDAETTRLLGMQSEFMQLQNEQQQTLNLIAERMPRR